MSWPVYSQTYHGPLQRGTGGDQLLLARGPWEPKPIFICGIALTHRTRPPRADAFAMAGSSAVDGDHLCHVSGSGTQHVMFPGRGFIFPGTVGRRDRNGETPHIDVHGFCDRANHEAWLTIFYWRSYPEDEPGPVPQANNDRLPVLIKKMPIYDYAPPISRWRYW